MCHAMALTVNMFRIGYHALWRKQQTMPHTSYTSYLGFMAHIYHRHCSHEVCVHA